MAKKQKAILNDPIFSLKAMSVDYFLLENPKRIEFDLGLKLTNVVGLNLNIRAGSRVVLFDELKIIQVLQTIIMETKPPLADNEVKLVEIQLAFDFEVSNYEDFRQDELKFSFTKDFLDKLSNISLSTSRGIIFSKLSGTFLQGIILPIIYITPIDLSSVIIIPKGGLTTQKINPT